MGTMTYNKAKSLLATSFTENYNDISEDEAADEVVLAEQALQKIEDEMDGDEQLTAAKNIAKDLGSAYKSAIKREKAKIAFFLGKIKEIQNGSVNPDSGLNDA